MEAEELETLGVLLQGDAAVGVPSFALLFSGQYRDQRELEGSEDIPSSG